MPDEKEGKDLNRERREELEAAFAVVNEYNKMNKKDQESPPAEPPHEETSPPPQQLPPPPPAGHSKPAVVLREIIKSVTPKPSPQQMTREERLQDRELLSQYKGPRLYWRIVTALTMIIPPLLALVATIDLIRVRNHELPNRYKFALHYCILLLVTGIGFNYFFWPSTWDTLGSQELWTMIFSLFALFFPPLLICIVIVDMIRRRNMRMGPSYLLHYILLFSGLSWLFIKVVIAPDLDAPDILEIVNILPAIYTDLFPPLLFLMIILGLFGIRNRHLASRHSHTIHYCRLLIVAGALWWILVATGEEFNFWATEDDFRYNQPPSKVMLDTFPRPAPDVQLSAKDIARDYTPLVAKLERFYRYKFAPGKAGHSGSAVVIMTDQDNVFLLTCLHVVQRDLYQNPMNNSIFTQMEERNKYFYSQVVGCHKSYDLALIRALREKQEGGKEPEDFFLPIRDFDSIERGEPLFVIGHPMGQDFSITDGLVSQKQDDEYVQLSAPISPGNSGGPIFDAHGNLMAIVSSSVNYIYGAQNLNRAVRADAVFDIKEWIVTDEGKIALEEITEMHGKVEKN